MNDSAVVFENVNCNIGKNLILENITLNIKKGEITGILGPNGAGKSTLLSLINGLRNHSEGNIFLLGEKLPIKQEMRRKLGVVLQETALYEELTTYENLSFSASLYDVVNPMEKIIEVLELLDLVPRVDQQVNTLSGGMRRRITIARALLHDPELLIIDEPTLGVDVEARHSIWQYLRLLKSRGRTVIVATNYLDEAQALCDMVAVLRKGKLLTYETPEMLTARCGYCIDIECNEEMYKKVEDLVSVKSGFLRIDRVETGATLFLDGKTAQKDIIRLILDNATINGIKVRAPDLAEVFNSFEDKI